LFIAGYFWHITDLHFDPQYSTKGDVLRSKYFFFLVCLFQAKIQQLIDLEILIFTLFRFFLGCWHNEHHQSPSPLTRSPGQFGDYMCDSPWSLLESATQTMKARQGDNVEFVLWTA